jgi:hypothetical protein
MRQKARTIKRTARHDGKSLKKQTRIATRSLIKNAKTPDQVKAAAEALKKQLIAKRAAVAKINAARKAVAKKPVAKKPVPKPSVMTKQSAARVIAKQKGIDKKQNQQITQLQRKLVMLQLHNKKIAAITKLTQQNKKAIAQLKAEQQKSAAGVRTLAPKEAKVRPLYNPSKIRVNAAG